jgi:predicted small secreted protein
MNKKLILLLAVVVFGAAGVTACASMQGLTAEGHDPAKTPVLTTP